MKQLLIVILLTISIGAIGQSVGDIIADIYEQVAEYGGEWEDYCQELMELHTHKINLNTATAAELERLRFLSERQIDELLTYVDKHPMASIAELQLVPCLREYEVRNLSYFVTAEPVKQTATLYPREVFAYAKHELTLRTDARNIENAQGDPMYGNLRYRFNYHNQVLAGWTMLREAGKPWEALHYGGYIQLNDIAPHLKTLVVGNFQGQFGQGLVLGESLRFGKSSHIFSTNGAEGVRKYSSVSDSYDYLHGIAATLQWGRAEITPLYSIRQERDSMWHHVVGLNATYKTRGIKVGLTALEEVYRRDSCHTIFGLNAHYKKGRWAVWGEVASSYDGSARCDTAMSRWGWGTIMGTSWVPTEGLSLMLFYRYYSPTYHSRYAQAFAETSKVNDENGVYIGTEIQLVPKWRFSIYADGWYFSGPKYGIPQASWGWDVMAQADYNPTEAALMFWKVRAKRKYVTDTYSLRYQFNWDEGGWHLRTQLDGSLVKKDTAQVTWGVSVFQDIAYTFRRVPITLQLRVQGFDVRNWDNRIYIYENDVLYASSIPAMYHVGGRLYLNMRYKIGDHLSAYCRVSETLYHPNWTGGNKPTRTDVHLMLRATF
ncbi:MAG: helix-hairpin-helix domain-containing protein [Paludibacteraceae bacterium]|nr:helix-hairpin-helix domain-containing protein [Paludibacteraceae bacterium]